ncbi:MAG: hypothetical protein ACTS73_01665 [Arsenophonus sp. NEOnobi-MAG3]
MPIVNRPLSSLAVIHNNYLPEQIIQIGSDDIEIKVPKIYGSQRLTGIYFNS